MRVLDCVRGGGCATSLSASQLLCTLVLSHSSSEAQDKPSNNTRTDRSTDTLHRPPFAGRGNRLATLR